MALTMISGAKKRCSAPVPSGDPVAQDSQAIGGPLSVDHLDSPSVEIDDQVYAQRLATVTDLDGDPGPPDPGD